MILDVEPYEAFYRGGRDSVRPLMSKIRAALPGAFHMGMTVDPRKGHYAEIFPDEWFPFVNSIHMQVYWGSFEKEPEEAFANSYNTWSGYKRPLFPVLQAHDVSAASVEKARRLAIDTYKANGMSWWVLGHISANEFEPINRTLNGVTPPAPPGADGKPVNYGAAVIVQPGSPDYTDGAFPDPEPSAGKFETYLGYAGGTGKYHTTSDHVSNVWARWDPHIRQSGWYTLEAFIPNLHASTGKARYKLHGVKDEASEVIMTVPQADYNHEWATIGTFQIDAGAQQPGVVYLNDWTFEPGLEIAFDALRWRPVVGQVTLQVVGNITFTAREIFQRGKTLGNRPNVFSRVGDSITASPYFLTPIGLRQFDLGAYKAELEPVVQYFSQVDARAGNSFANSSLAAGNGWGADRIIQPGYAYTDVCGNTMPLVCEYKNVKPSAALIMIGTNDSGGVAPDVYTANLRRIVDISIEMGVVPILSTIPPKRLGDWDTTRVTQWNDIIRNLAWQYAIPLLDYWYALQSAPNQGVGPDGIHPSVPPDGATGRFTPTNLQYGYTLRNLTALQMLKAMMSGVMY
jgi:hypothetical protein